KSSVAGQNRYNAFLPDDPKEHAMSAVFRSARVALAVVGAAGLFLLFGGHAESQKDAAPVDGTKVQWEGWNFNWQLRPLEGLVLPYVHYRGRKVLKYAGIAEILTAYDQGQPRPLDLSQNGLGEPLMPIVPGVDCSSGEWCKVFDAKGKLVTKG